LRRWLDLLVESKQSRAREEPELFATYTQLAADAREVIGAHVKTLTDQLAQIIAYGVAQGEFDVANPEVAARAVFDATAGFHNPANAPAWSDPGNEVAYAAVPGPGGSYKAYPRVNGRDIDRRTRPRASCPPVAGTSVVTEVV
jgi:Tetracyclin repressor-like, C-terminal domain